MRKTLFILFCISIVLFLDHLLLIIIGSTANSLGAGDNFYCSTYCIISLGVVVLSLIGIAFPVWKVKSFQG